MKTLSRFIFSCSAVLMVGAAHAAGTYYTGNYQSPQRGYSTQSYAQRANTTPTYSQQGISAYTRNQYANAGYSAGYSSARGNQITRNATPTQPQTRAATQSSNGGFSLSAGISRQTSMYQFEMKTADSILHYDNVDWNVFDVNAGFVFGNTTPMQITAGFKYGMQSGESTMIDDDITNGGYFVTEWYDTGGNFLGDQIGHALSIGTSKNGSMMEFNAGFGLTDFFRWGNVKITPSVGWRYLKYSLETHQNHGLSIDTFTGTGGCITDPISGEYQCDPILIFYDSAGNKFMAIRTDYNDDSYIDMNDPIKVPTGYDFVEMGGTFYFEQPDISHKYDVEWSGPYFALDMLYDINQHNAVNAHLELGLPSYTSTGDQPYRFDWQHPKSIEDTAGIGSAFHLGMGANWTTALSDSVALSLGVTYDYYTVSDADAKTYLNGDYYMGIYDTILESWLAEGKTEADMLDPETGNIIAQNIAQTAAECPGWVCTSPGEIASFYKSLGVRIGINAKF